MTVGFGNALGTFAGMTRRQVHAALAQRIPGLDLDKGSTSGHREMAERAIRRVLTVAFEGGDVQVLRARTGTEQAAQLLPSGTPPCSPREGEGAEVVQWCDCPKCGVDLGRMFTNTYWCAACESAAQRGEVQVEDEPPPDARSSRDGTVVFEWAECPDCGTARRCDGKCNVVFS